MALRAPPACVREAMMRVQLEVGSLQDETLVSTLRARSRYMQIN